MNLSKYRVGSKVRIEMFNGFYFKGVVVNSEPDNLTIEDINGNLTTLSEKSILYIKEEL